MPLSEEINIRRIQGIIVFIYVLIWVSFLFVPYGDTVGGMLAVFWYLGGIFYARHLAYIKNRDRNGWTLLALLNPIVTLFILCMLKSLEQENDNPQIRE